MTESYQILLLHSTFSTWNCINLATGTIVTPQEQKHVILADF